MANSEFRKQALTPIALFAYNRPRHVERALGALARCARFEECRVHVYCDGPRDDAQGLAVNETRRVVRNWAKRLEAVVIERDENLGLARSIVGGVTDLCQKHGRVIVLEDDLEVGPTFLNYMLQALDRYDGETNVYQISGYMFPVEHSPNPDAFFLPLTTTWGWATWQRAWRVFAWETPGMREALTDPGVRHRFDLESSYPCSRLLEQRLAGQNDSWGVLWWWAVFSIGGLVLHPRRSLVQVGGFDGTGTHCGRSRGSPSAPAAVKEFSFGSEIHFPDRVAADGEALTRIIQFLRQRRGVECPT